MDPPFDFDLVVIGLGTAGMTAAETAADLGLRVCAIERERAGGDCLWTRCLSSKALSAARVIDAGDDRCEVRRRQAACCCDMNGRVRIVTDSNTMVPWPRVDDLDIVVVPPTVTIGGDELIEDRALDIAGCYRRLRAREPAATSAPLPGSFAARFEHLAHRTGRFRIGVGDAGPVVDDLVDRLRAARPFDEIVRYIGPTVAAHAGMGTFGVVFHPLPDSGAT